MKKYKKSNPLKVSSFSSNKKKEIDPYVHFTTVLEGIRSDFKVFGESLAYIRDKVDVLEREMSELKERVLNLEISQSIMREDIAEIKIELKEIRAILTQKADIHQVDNLEKRVVRIEETLSAQE